MNIKLLKVSLCAWIFGEEGLFVAMTTGTCMYIHMYVFLTLISVLERQYKMANVFDLFCLKVKSFYLIL